MTLAHTDFVQVRHWLGALDPHAKFDCMDAVGCRDAVLPREQIAHGR